MYEWQLSRITTFKQLASFYEENKIRGLLCFHVHGSFGDIYLQLSHLKYRASRAGAPFAVLIDPHYINLARRAIPSNSMVIAVQSLTLNALLTDLGLLGKGDGSFPTRLLPTLYPLIAELVTRGALHYTTFLEFLIDIQPIDKLPSLESEVEHAWARNYVEALGLPVGSSVLICADNNSQKELSAEFWNNIINVIRRLGLTPCLNDSGSTGKSQSRTVTRQDIIRIKVDPDKAISIVSACGFYVGGTNGFIGIQSIFNSNAKGINFINAIGSDGKEILDRGGEKVPIRAFYYEQMYAKQFLGKTIERLVHDETDFSCIESAFKELVLL
jgi:hypothetical protein